MTKFEEFEQIMRTLRAPDGCPWDSKQTHMSLKAACIEEAAEVICGINVFDRTGNAENLKEELGDLLMQVVMHALIAEEEGLFDMDDVIQGIADKMIRRHPHVFAKDKEESADEHTLSWEEIKKLEKVGKEPEADYLPDSFEEAKQLIDRARERKKFVKIPKTILCYGDSNTYGYNPSNGMRYPSDVRWTSRLQGILGSDYKIIEEGCNGRTTVHDDPIEGWKNGLDYLKPCLNTHKPIDMVILMLGSNDLKNIFHASAEQIASGAETLVKEIQEFCPVKQGSVPKIVLVSPAQIGPDIADSPFGYAFDQTAIDRSKEFAACYKAVAERNGCIFLDAAAHVTASKLDSLHFTPEAHAALAEELAKIVHLTF